MHEYIHLLPYCAVLSKLGTNNPSLPPGSLHLRESKQCIFLHSASAASTGCCSHAGRDAVTVGFISNMLAFINTSWISCEAGLIYDIYLYICGLPKQTGPPMELIQRLRHQIRRKWGLIADAPTAATPSLKLQAVRARSLSALSHLAAERDWGSKFYFFIYSFALLPISFELFFFFKLELW